MTKSKQIFLSPLKGHDPNNPKLEVDKKENSLNKNSKLLQYRYKKTNIIMMIVTITTTMRIIDVNLEDIDLVEDKIQVNFSEVKIHMVEANTIKIHTKAISKQQLSR